MQITRAAEYAIRGVLYLCSQPKGAVCLLNEISEKQNIPPSFLSKIFQNLSRTGYVSSSRGTGGGFTLLRDPEEITLLDIVEAIDGQIALNVCLNNGSLCDNKPTCAVHRVWDDAQSYLTTLLNQSTFASLAEKNRKLAESRNMAENMAYQSEKLLKEQGEKIAADKKGKVEAAIKEVRSAISSDDPEKIQRSVDELNTAMQAVSADLYSKARQGQQPGPTPNEAPGQDPGAAGQPEEKGEVIDADYEMEDDKKK